MGSPSRAKNSENSGWREPSRKQTSDLILAPTHFYFQPETRLVPQEKKTRQEGEKAKIHIQIIVALNCVEWGKKELKAFLGVSFT